MKSKIMALMSISYLIVFAIIIMVSILSYFDFVDENITSMKADNEILAITNPKQFILKYFHIPYWHTAYIKYLWIQLFFVTYLIFYKYKTIKTYIYISGLMSGLLFMGWLISIAMGLDKHLLFLISSLISILFIYLPLVYTKRRQHKIRMQQIIEDYKKEEESDNQLTQEKTDNRGWGLNDSPFRERKSGLTWGGGNIHAANATRGRRKAFRK